MSATFDSPEIKADRLLRDVLGEGLYGRFKSVGYLDLPSRKFRGRMYRLDTMGNLSYRDAGEATFNTALCVQPQEAVPRDDQVVMRYLLVTADEDRLLSVANPITFGFMSLARAMRYDFAQRYSEGLASLFTVLVIAFFLVSLLIEAWALASLLPHHPTTGILTFLLFLLPAFVGAVLLASVVADVWRWAATRAARGRAGD